MAEDKKPLRIVSLQAEDVKRIVAINIAPNGAMVEIAGKNGQGKTTILDCISWALEGAGAVQAAPIRKGKDKAWIKLDLGDYVVTRTFDKVEGGTFTTSMKVENKDGGRLTKGQTLVDSFLGKVSMDPLAFLRMKPKEQFDMLKGYVTEVDIEDLDAANLTDFSRRTDINRQAKAKRNEADAIPVPETTPVAKVDEAALIEELGQVGTFNAELERRAERREAVKALAEQQRREADSFRLHANEHRQRAIEIRRKADEDIAAAEAEAVAADAKAVATDAEAAKNDQRLADAPPLEAPKDVADVRARIDAAKKTNQAVDQAEKRKALRAEADKLEQASKDLTAAIEARETRKREAIAAAKMPVEGIAFAEGALLLNGVPFEQASDAEQLRASVAIAMAAEPRLKVMRIREGSLLDEDGMRIVAEMAETAGWQVWVERVDSSGSRGFVIEDGHVRSTPAQRAQQGDLLGKAE